MNENYYMLKEFYEDCREYELSEVIERWSGIRVDVPAFVGAIRDVRIKADYALLQEDIPKDRKYLILAQKYRVSKRKIINAVKSTTPATASNTPSLFDV